MLHEAIWENIPFDFLFSFVLNFFDITPVYPACMSSIVFVESEDAQYLILSLTVFSQLQELLYPTELVTFVPLPFPVVHSVQ